MKVLIIDDCLTSLALAKARLCQEDLQVICASSGLEGLEAAHQQMPDLILLDLDMPDISGFELCATLKADPALAMIPIIFLTGSVSVQDKVRGLDLGAIDYVTKPFDSVELRARVRVGLRMKSLQDAQLRLMTIDPLTELNNRRALEERLQQEWSRTTRYGGLLSLIMMDLDFFKQVNDRHGHLSGDEVLRQVAVILTRHCRKCDLAARYGGEEFVVLAPQTSAEQAAELAERYRLEIASSTWSIGGISTSLTASFGVADSTASPSHISILQRADEALYTAKRDGRNLVRVYPAPVHVSASAPQAAAG